MTHKLWGRLAPLAAALVLAACGGSDYKDDTPPPQAADPLREVPASANQSSAGLVGYLGQLPSLDAEKRDPVSLDAFTPAADDGSEPQPVGG
jgi:hypothetical protein